MLDICLAAICSERCM